MADRDSGLGGAALARPPERVLIVLLGAIGDVVRALPLAQRLRAAWPSARIAWAVEPAAAPIVEGHPALSEVIRFERRTGPRAFAAFLAAVRRSAPDLSLDLQRHLKSGVTSWWSGASVRVGFPWRNSREGNWLFHNRHVAAVEHFSPKVEQFLSFADHLGAAAAPVSFGLGSTPGERTRVGEMLADVRRPFAAFFLGSTWPSRSWFPAPSAALVRGLAERGVGVALIGGGAERPMADAILAERPGPVTDLVGRTTLRHAIGVLEQAAVAVGPDSGPMHIAAAVGTPVVSLWGATSPARSAPHGSEDLVVRGRAPCAPCYLSRCPIGRPCMESIGAEAVLERLDRALTRTRGS
jgi:lipopolysaccharide heptosyltransferase II